MSREKRPIGKLYGKDWNPFPPKWIVYETEKCYTLHLSRMNEEDESAVLSVKTSLPSQSRPETKVNLEIHLAVACPRDPDRFGTVACRQF